jgi:hypothetical protein
MLEGLHEALIWFMLSNKFGSIRDPIRIHKKQKQDVFNALIKKKVSKINK